MISQRHHTPPDSTTPPETAAQDTSLEHSGVWRGGRLAVDQTTLRHMEGEPIIKDLKIFCFTP